MYSVDEHLGSMEDLQRLVREAHDRGMTVIQDQVANHTGPYHRWANDPPTPSWWNGTVDKHTANNWQKWTAMSPRSTSDVRSLNLDGWFIDILPDFNQHDPEVSRYLIQNSLWWIATAEFDAIRMDTLPHVPRSFWNQWASALKREYPDIVILGELFDSDPVLLSYYQGGRTGHDGIDTRIDHLFDFGLFSPIRNAFAKGRSIREVHQMFSRDWLYPDPNRLTTFVGVHDMQRFMSEEGATTAGLKMAFTLIATSRGTPLLYYGDEIAMKGGPDPDNRRDFPGGFPGDPRDAFLAEARTPAENDVWNHIAKLGSLRKEYSALRRGKSIDLLDGEQQYAYARQIGDDCLVVVFNNEATTANASFSVREISTAPISQGWSIQCDDLLGGRFPLVVEQGVGSVSLPARTSAIYRLPPR
jgi:glycosidase